MAMATKIIRSSIHAFLRSYQLFSSITGLIVLPASMLTLLSQALFSSPPPALYIISNRLCLLFKVAGIPSSQFLNLLNVKLAQTIFSFVFTLPFTLTFLLSAKVSIIQEMVNESSPGRRRRRRLPLPPFSTLLPLYRSVLLTHLFNSFLMLAAKATVFAVLCLAFSAADVLGLASNTCALLLSAAGFVLYVVVIGNATVVCNLSIVVSAVESCSGHLALARASVLVRGTVATALALAMTANLGMALAEALFRYRLIRPYYHSRKHDRGMATEAYVVAYVYSLVVVLDTVMSCMFYDRCKFDLCSELEQEEKSSLRDQV